MPSSSSRNCEEIKRELEKIAEEIRVCTRCPLHLNRTNAVPGEGDPCSGVVFIGEAPGQSEDVQGRPFVGSAGQLLTQLLSSNGISRESVFITNVVKCRPPGNREPREEEIKACLPYLRRQLEAIKPRVIITLGRHSTRTVLGMHGHAVNSIMGVRGREFMVEESWGSLVVFPTLHPAAALYNPGMRSSLEDDFKRISRIIKGEETKGQKTLDSFFAKY
ncbi:MAG: type-4 uracil-DNA glycosylase [Infirmifilum sp.]